MNILMYHSIGDGPGPLSISFDTFRRQLDALSAAGVRGVALRDAIQPARERASRMTGHVAALTFDDGYRDFVSTAWPEIAARGWGATVFLSTGLVGKTDGWDPDGSGARPMLDWAEVCQVSAAGAELGAHAVTHRDLTQLPIDDAANEIVESRRAIASQTGAQATSFAAPYGRTTAAVRAQIARVYDCAVSARMGRVDDSSNRFDLPRIEMWYFRDLARWRAYLEGATTYFTMRRALREARQFMGQIARSRSRP